jgi:hypothetical protein
MGEDRSASEEREVGVAVSLTEPAFAARSAIVAPMSIALGKPRMTRAEFFHWAQNQGARYEFP